MDEFDLLIQQGNLGFYTSCEVTHVIVFDKKNRQAYNYYTVFVFEERKLKNTKPEYLTEKPLSLSKCFSLCIMQYQIELKDARQNYEKLIVASATCDIGCGHLSIGRFKKLSKQFIPYDSTKTIPLNKGLKNNFQNGSYILELFDIQKPLSVLMSKKELHLAAQKLHEILPIDLFVLSDRIGNVVFQFPSQILGVVFKTDKEEQNLEFNLSIDNRILNPQRYLVMVTNEFDNTFVGFGIKEQVEQTSFALNTGNTASLNQIKVIDKETQLIVSLASTGFIRSMKVNMHIGSQFGNVRTIIDGNGHTITVPVDSRESFGIPRKNILEWKDYTRKRQYQMDLEKLEKQMKFIQYGGQGRNDREKAMLDIRKLIERFEESKVYLWDPFLSADDILNTLYFTRHYNTELRAITSGILRKRNNIDGTSYSEIKQWIADQKQLFETRSNNYGIKLEVRCQHGNYGFPFHDRFLIFISEEETAKVWSLGTSINSLGTAHHIVQEVNHPQHIVDTFEQLWNSLDNDGCLVWNSQQLSKKRI
jgi:bifunctional DNA-binding transcriptional regulator/antitoxin component of YhaV-PrlF toxin-antitoxin module